MPGLQTTDEAGLGLAITGEIAIGLDGPNGVRSHPNDEGILAFVLSADPCSGVLANGTGTASSSTPKHVLVVNGEPGSRLRLRAALELAGYAVVEAGNDEEACDELHQSPIDLVFLDLRMPLLEGPRALRKLREAGGDVPVVLITARGNRIDAKAALELGVIDYLFKPVAPEVLRTTAAEVIRRNAATSSKPVSPQQTAAMIAALFGATMTQAQRALNLREFRRAEMFLRQAAALRPESATAQNLLGALRESRGDRQEAFRCYQAANRAEPGQEVARLNLLRLYHSE
jgi:DNA-binding response OmpR family regulator